MLCYIKCTVRQRLTDAAAAGSDCCYMFRSVKRRQSEEEEEDDEDDEDEFSSSVNGVSDGNVLRSVNTSCLCTETPAGENVFVQCQTQTFLLWDS